MATKIPRALLRKRSSPNITQSVKSSNLSDTEGSPASPNRDSLSANLIPDRKKDLPSPSVPEEHEKTKRSLFEKMKTLSKKHLGLKSPRGKKEDAFVDYCVVTDSRPSPDHNNPRTHSKYADDNLPPTNEVILSVNAEEKNDIGKDALSTVSGEALGSSMRNEDSSSSSDSSSSPSAFFLQSEDDITSSNTISEDWDALMAKRRDSSHIRNLLAKKKASEGQDEGWELPPAKESVGEYSKHPRAITQKSQRKLRRKKLEKTISHLEASSAASDSESSDTEFLDELQQLIDDNEVQLSGYGVTSSSGSTDYQGSPPTSLLQHLLAITRGLPDKDVSAQLGSAETYSNDSTKQHKGTENARAAVSHASPTSSTSPKTPSLASRAPLTRILALPVLPIVPQTPFITSGSDFSTISTGTQESKLPVPADSASSLEKHRSHLSKAKSVKWVGVEYSDRYKEIATSLGNLNLTVNKVKKCVLQISANLGSIFATFMTIPMRMGDFDHSATKPIKEVFETYRSGCYGTYRLYMVTLKWCRGVDALVERHKHEIIEVMALSHSVNASDTTIGKFLYRLSTQDKSEVKPFFLTESDMTELFSLYWMNRRTSNVFFAVFKWLQGHITDQLIIRWVIHATYSTRQNLFFSFALDVVVRVYERFHETAPLRIAEIGAKVATMSNGALKQEQHSQTTLIPENMLNQSEDTVSQSEDYRRIVSIQNSKNVLFHGSFSGSEDAIEGTPIQFSIKNIIDGIFASNYSIILSKRKASKSPARKGRSHASDFALTDSVTFFNLANLIVSTPYNNDRKFYHETMTYWKDMAYLQILVELIITNCVISGPKSDEIDEDHFKAVVLATKSLLSALKRYIRSQVSSMTTSYNMSYISPFISIKTELENQLAAIKRKKNKKLEVFSHNC